MKKYNIIAIERQYASGGQKIGEVVGQILNRPVYGREILNMVAREHNVNPEYIEHMEETATTSLLYNFVQAVEMAAKPMDSLSPSDRLFYAESQLITRLSLEVPCVFVGRCAGAVLAQRADCLRVFVYTDMESRINRCITEYGLDPSDAVKTIKRIDKRRANYYNNNSNTKWDDKDGYHLMLNSNLGVEACGEMIAKIARGQ